MPLLENNTTNKQSFNVNLMQRAAGGYSNKGRKPHDLPKNPSSMVDMQDKRHFFSNEVCFSAGLELSGSLGGHVMFLFQAILIT